MWDQTLIPLLGGTFGPMEEITFAIENSEDFYRMLIADFDEFCDDETSSRLAIHCAITAYHMVDWVWGDWLKNDAKTRSALGIDKSIDSFKQWIDDHSVWFAYVQGIANGSKHFAPHNFGAEAIGGFGHGPFGFGTYGKPYLLVDLGSGLPDDGRFMSAASLLEVVVRFWRDFLRANRPNPDRVDSGNHSN